MAELSAKEAEIYDRQIRLWGVEAQQRLRGARVFVCGLTGLGGEVCKNLVLAGISVTLLDDATVTPEQLGAANFLLDADSLGKNRALACKAKAQELNQLVVVSARGVGLDGVSDAELLGGSSSSGGGSSSSSDSSLAVQPPLVIACDLDPPALVAACARCRRLAVPILAAATLAYHGFVFQDAGASRSYLYQPPAAQGGGGGDAPAPPAQPRTAHFRSLAQVLEGSAAAAHAALARARGAQPAAHAWLALLCAGAGAGAGSEEGGGAALAAAWRARDAAALGAAAQEQLARGCSGGGGGGAPAGSAAACAALAAAWAAGGELSPVAAVVGAMVANEAMKVVTGKDAPMRSLLCFDGMGGTGGRVYEV